MNDSTDPLADTLTETLPVLLTALEAMEVAQQAFHPARPESVIEFLNPFLEPLSDAQARLEPLAFPEHVEKFGLQLKTAFTYAVRSAENYRSAGTSPDSGMRAARTLSKARAHLFPLATLLNPIHQFFLEPSLRVQPQISELWQQEPLKTPLIHIENDYDQRGGASIFIPHWLDPNQATPVVVALHGGTGHGRDMLWSWVREARSRGFVVIAPTSQDQTWQLHHPEQEMPALLALIEFVAQNTHIDRNKIMLTGMSDGATLTLQLGLSQGSPFTHLAPFSGTLDPALIETGAVALARDKSIYLVHGSQDWMFPVEVGKMTHQILEAHNHHMIYREIDGLGHAFARSELTRLLPWFSDALNLES